jgi:hypothetical protein
MQKNWFYHELSDEYVISKNQLQTILKTGVKSKKLP